MKYMTHLWLLLSFPGAAFASEQAAPGMVTNVFQVLFGLLVVLGIMGGLLWLIKRFPGVTRGFHSNTIKVIAGINVGSRERILLVEIADQWLVVGVAPGRVNTLATLPRGESPATDAITTPNLAAWLKQTIDKRNK